jgi:hypothetical protein
MLNRFYFLIVVTLLWAQSYGWTSLARAQDSPSMMETLALLSSLSEFSIDSGVYFDKHNPKKNKILLSVLSKYGLTEAIFWDQPEQTRINLLSTKNPISIPNIEVRKIHAAKYRIRILNAKGDFPLNFNESYHQGWRLYLVPWSLDNEILDSSETQEILSFYKTLKGNEETQANLKDVKRFIQKGLITDIDSDLPSFTNPYDLIKKIGQSSSHSKKLKTNFISKNIFNTIQNENLPTGSFWETWFSGSIVIKCEDKPSQQTICEEIDAKAWQVTRGFANTFEWPEQLHWRINAQTNGWWIDTNFLHHATLSIDKNNLFYQTNQDKSFDFELVMEFWPQRLFYIGGIISTIVLLSSLGLLFLRRNRKQPKLAIQ